MARFKSSGDVSLRATSDQDLDRRQLVDIAREGSQYQGGGLVIFTFVKGVDNNHQGRERIANLEKRVYEELFQLVT